MTIYGRILPKKQALILQRTHAKRHRLWSNAHFLAIGPEKQAYCTMIVVLRCKQRRSGMPTARTAAIETGIIWASPFAAQCTGIVMKTRASAVAGSAVFFLLAPCIVAGVLPWLVLDRYRMPFSGFLPQTLLGALLIITAIAVLVHCFARFALEGSGTPARSRRPKSWSLAVSTASSATRCMSRCCRSLSAKRCSSPVGPSFSTRSSWRWR